MFLFPLFCHLVAFLPTFFFFFILNMQIPPSYGVLSFEDHPLWASCSFFDFLIFLRSLSVFTPSSSSSLPFSSVHLPGGLPPLLIVAWRRCWSRFSLWERIKRGFRSRLCAKCSSEESRPRLRRCKEKKKEEEPVKMNKSKAEPVSSWCYQRQAGSTKVVHRRAVWTGEGGRAGRSGTQGDHKRGPSRSPGRHSMDAGADDDLGE